MRRIARMLRIGGHVGVLAGALCLLLGGGCTGEPSFPSPIKMHLESGEMVISFDTDGNKHADFWQYQDPNGRKQAIAYAVEATGEAGDRIELDAIPPAECPHFVIALDGVPFELVEQLYQDGRFRFFHPPSRVICCFPSMTDLALAELFHVTPCRAYQAVRFDRGSNRIASGSGSYLGGDNSPWLEKMDYRCSFWWDANAYLTPTAVFRHELKGIHRTFRTADDGQVCAYSVGTAGLGTRGGREAILDYLRTIDRLCEQIIYERRGRVKLTLTADHGHNLVENRRISLDEALAAGGYRRSKSLRGPKDVVTISYGLVTYVEVYTQEPAGVAAYLVNHDDVEFVCYPADDAIVVCDRSGEARITQGDAGFRYDLSRGDPLQLGAIVERLRGQGSVSADGSINGDALFDATVDHVYPDPLPRIWGAFHGLVENPPDLVVNLRDGACYGSRFFHTMIRKVTSTHGSLNRINSTTFVMTMLGELPPALRSRDVLPALEEARAPR